MIRIHMDDETYGEIDLTKVGAYAYARHPATDILLMSFAVDDGHKQRWRPGDPVPAVFFKKNIEIEAWNSQFERLIYWEKLEKRYGWPHLELEQFVCVAAQARAMAACPSKLEIAALFLDRPFKKDMKGHRHMLYMCKPAPEKEQLEFMRGLRDGESAAEWAEKAKRCHHTPRNLDRLHDYCDTDLESERDIGSVLPEWNEDVLQAFWESERINDEGLVVDREFALAATEYAEDEKAYFNKRIAEITSEPKLNKDGEHERDFEGNLCYYPPEVTTPRQFQRINKWCLPKMCDEAYAMTVWYDNGVKKHSFDADTRANLLAEYARDGEFLDEDVAEFIEILDAAGKSTISKYEAITKRAIQDDEGRWRIHGLYMFAGAPQSGRYSSVGIQVHNLVRTVPPSALRLIKAFKRRDSRHVEQAVAEWADAINDKIDASISKPATTPNKNRKGIAENQKRYGTGANAVGRAGNPGRAQKRAVPEAIHALGQLVRPTITACPHGDFDVAWCDWSSIEAVVLPWLTLDPRAESRLELFRRGEDLYLKTASAICKQLITKEDEFERQAFGKVPELSLGYCGGAGAFMAMGKNYGVHLPERQVVGIVKDWREENPWAMDFARGLERAAMTAIRNPGVGYSHGRVEYFFDEDALDGIGALYAILPSGRALCYPNASIDVQVTPFGKKVLQITAMKGSWRPAKGAVEWPRVSVWYGLLAENATQGVATGDLLNAALIRARRKYRLRVCGTTHDEIKIYTPQPEIDAPRLHDCMVEKPKWPGIDALPLRADYGYGYRYKVKFAEAA